MTSRDVIHSFYVPDFRIKQDVVPGRYTTVWFNVIAPGRHEVLCTQYCGTYHSTMRAEIIALAAPEWDRFIGRASPTARIAGQPYTMAETPGNWQMFAPAQQLDLVRLGEQAAARLGCLRCHSVDGSRHIGPTFAGLYLSRVPLENGEEVVGDEAYITESMMDPLAKVHQGFEPVMPSYLGLISPAETAAIIEYVKALSPVPPAPDQGRGSVAPRPSGTPPPGEMGQPPRELGTRPPDTRPGFVLPSEQGTPIPGHPIQPPPQGRIEIRP